MPMFDVYGTVIGRRHLATIEAPSSADALELALEKPDEFFTTGLCPPCARVIRDSRLIELVVEHGGRECNSFCLLHDDESADDE